MRTSISLAVLLIGCSGAPPRDPSKAIAVDPLHLSTALKTPVKYTGLLFGDQTCRQIQPGTIGTDALPAFGKCLELLGLNKGPRQGALPDEVLYVYGPGIEVSARFQLGDGGAAHVEEIGYIEGGSNPTLTPSAFDALRGGTNELKFTDAQRDQLDKIGDTSAWLKICVDSDGSVTDVRTIEASSPYAGEVYAEAVKAWRVTPFQLRDHAIPACTVHKFGYPNASNELEALPLPTAAEGGPPSVYLDSLGTRIAGTSEIVPDSPTKIELAQNGNPPLAAGVRFCIDGSGKVSTVKVVAPSGLKVYDDELQSGVKAWAFKPYLRDGKAIPVCSAVTFHYSQS